MMTTRQKKCLSCIRYNVNSDKCNDNYGKCDYIYITDKPRGKWVDTKYRNYKVRDLTGEIVETVDDF